MASFNEWSSYKISEYDFWRRRFVIVQVTNNSRVSGFNSHQGLTQTTRYGLNSQVYLADIPKQRCVCSRWDGGALKRNNKLKKPFLCSAMIRLERIVVEKIKNNRSLKKFQGSFGMCTIQKKHTHTHTHTHTHSDSHSIRSAVLSVGLRICWLHLLQKDTPTKEMFWV